MKTIRLLLTCAAFCGLVTGAFAQGTAFTYQGVLSQSGVAANGSNDLTFTLYNAVTAGAPVGTSNVVNDLLMSNGLFTVTLDFGAGAFDGSARWLQIAGRPGASTGAYTNLVPRQPITPTPYAIYAGGASLAGTYGGAVNFSNAANQFSGVGSSLTALNASQLASGTVPAGALSNAWKTTGNTGTTPGAQFLGTTDNQPLDFRVNNLRGLRLEFGQDIFSQQAVNVIGGSSANAVSNGLGGTIAGGGFFGSPNRAAGNATVGGGNGNTAGGVSSTVAGGQGNTANGQSSTVGGGLLNIVGGLDAIVGGGRENSASANWATVPGGLNNTAGGLYSFAAGRRAKANHQGAFVWADSVDADFASTADRQFLIRAAGGVGINTATPGGVFGVQVPISFNNSSATVSFLGEDFTPALVMTGGPAPGILRVRNALEIWPNTATTSPGKIDVRGTNGTARITLDGANGEITTVALNITSDRNAKEQFKPVNARDVLAKVARLPISEWQYKEHSDARHIGPMAQDFHAAFAVGRDEKHITTVDADGVALAAIQGLNEKLEEQARDKDTRIHDLETAVSELKQLVNKLATQQNGGVR